MNKFFPLFFRSLVFGGLLGAVSAVSGVTLGQMDDFQSGSTAGWIHGQSNPHAPRVLADDGPGGVGDFALTVSASGTGGAGSRLIMFNRGQWTGDFLNSGVTGIRFDARHNDGPDLPLRIAFNGPGGQFSLTDPILLSVGSGWVTHVFPLDASAFQHVGGGSGSWAATMGGVTEARLLSAASPSWRGDSVAASLSVDNIQAVPEPRLVSLLTGLFLFGFLGARAVARVCLRTR